MGRACSTNWSEEECTWDIGVKTRRKETTTKTKMLMVDNIKMNLREMAWVNIAWIHPA
jgi:hypothetical protein